MVSVSSTVQTDLTINEAKHGRNNELDDCGVTRTFWRTGNGHIHECVHVLKAHEKLTFRLTPNVLVL